MLVQKKVLWLQVTMHNIMFVAVLDSTDNLLEKASRFVFG